MAVAHPNHMTLRELAFNMEHSGLYELSHEDFLNLPPNTIRQAQVAANDHCPVCNTSYRGVVLAFTDLDHIGIEYWIKCANCEHTRRWG